MKKLPPWAIIGIAVAAGALVWFVKRQRQQQKELAESQEESQSVTQSQVEGTEYEGGYPVTGGAVGGGGAIGTASEYGQQQREFEQQFTHEQGEFDKTLFSSLAESNKALLEAIKNQPIIAQGSGGGASVEPRPGVTPAGPSGGGTPTPTTPKASCPGAYPHYNPAGGSVGPHACYKDGRCGDGCEGHFYQDGHSECQHKSGGRCVW